MWMLLIIASLVTLYAGDVDAVCGNPPPVWRNNNSTCPERAVCADVFNMVRDWYNGTRCQERRVVHNCICSGDTVCPLDDDHLFYNTPEHLLYTCQTRCQLPYCLEISQRPNQGRSTFVVAQSMEQNAREFGNRNYYRMGCRCPRHHVPRRQTTGVHRAVHASNTIMLGGNRWSTQYVCTVHSDERNMTDPCSSSTTTSIQV